MKLETISFKSSKHKNQLGCIPDKGTIILSGKTNSGKSTILRDILRKKQDVFHYAYCVSETEAVNCNFQRHIPLKLIDYEYNSRKMEKVLEYHKRNFMKTSGKARMAIIMDDCMSDTSFLKDKAVRKLFLESRHFNILFILCTQYFIDIPRGLRSNVQWVSFSSDNNIESRRIIYKQFFGFFPTFREFDNVFKKYTTDYSVIFIQPSSASYEVKENAFWYRSNSVSSNGNYKHEFHIGVPSIWNDGTQNGPLFLNP